MTSRLNTCTVRNVLEINYERKLGLSTMNTRFGQSQPGHALSSAEGVIVSAEGVIVRPEWLEYDSKTPFVSQSEGHGG